MISFLKRNKLFTSLLLITVIILLIGILLPGVIDKSIKDNISNNIIKMISDLKTNRVGVLTNFKNTLFSNYSNIIIIWLLGISIIGIPIILFLYIMKVLLLGLELTFLLINIKSYSIIFIIIYLIPIIFNILVLFFLVYYSLTYSIILIRLLFFKKEYNLKLINRRYIKIFIVCLILSLLSTLIEVLLLPKILIFFL